MLICNFISHFLHIYGFNISVDKEVGGRGRGRGVRERGREGDSEGKGREIYEWIDREGKRS